MTVRTGVLTFLLAAGLVAAEQDRGNSEVTIHVSAAQGGVLPGMPVVVHSLAGDRQVVEKKCQTKDDGTCSIQLSKNYRFDLSVDVAGFLPVRLGPSFPPSDAHYHVFLVMNVLNPAFVTVP
jgi:hypothetical protein